MTFDEYQQGAVATESPIDEGIRSRYIECIPFIYTMLGDFRSGEEADLVKKYVFYGKGKGHPFQEERSKYIDPSVADRLLPTDDRTIRLIHAWLGIRSELPELARAIFLGDKVNIAEEFQDMGWYQAIGLAANGTKLSDAAKANHAKLKARYPEKFTQQAAIHRNLENEVSILEAHLA